jgi:transcriptional regulator with XRE-family HTH domain
MKLKNSKTNWYTLGDPMIVREIGKQFKQMRLNKNISQHKMSELTGLNRVTISKFENGRSATLLTVVQLLRALEKLELLNGFVQEQEISPLQIANLQETQRKRASAGKKKQNEERSEW